MSAFQSGELVDYHCHLDLYPECEKLFATCAEGNVSVLTVTTTPKAWPRNVEMAAPWRSIRVGLGLHPQLVADRSVELSLFETYLPEARFVGEIGLDASPRFYRSFDTQLKVFERILKLCSEAGGKILSVHSVRAAAHVVRLIERCVDPTRVAIVLHWFSGSNSDAKRAFDLGCYFSINCSMLDSPKGRSLVNSIPTTRLLTETDGPFIRIGDRPIVPTDVKLTLSDLAETTGTSIQETRSLVAANLQALESILPR